ncbi:TPA: hypothetical protein ACGO4F_000804 [Streptococcus suis]
MKLNVTYVWCFDCLTFHKPKVLEREEDVVGNVALQCPYREPFNSTLLIVKEAENDTEV